MGKGVLKAVENVNTIIAPELEGMNAYDQPLNRSNFNRIRRNRE